MEVAVAAESVAELLIAPIECIRWREEAFVVTEVIIVALEGVPWRHECMGRRTEPAALRDGQDGTRHENE